MKVEKIDRILIAVRDIEAASKRFSDLLGLKFDEVMVDEEQKVKYTRSAEGLELLQSTSPDGAVAKFIDKRGEGLYGVMIKVPDVASATEEMGKKGVQSVASSRVGGVEEAYFHPRDSHGAMLILCAYEAKHGATVAELQK